MSEHVMSRLQLLAAEIYAYSYANYIDHLGMGHVRYDNLMPEDAELLERAVTENWELERVAKAMEVKTDVAENLLSAARRALEVVDAENPAESFRNAVRQVVRRAAEEGLENDEAIEQLVIQICYRVSDLAYLLKRDGNPLSRYSRHFRRDPNRTYLEGHFDEGDDFE